jgi:hypothetical protein
MAWHPRRMMRGARGLPPLNEFLIARRIIGMVLPMDVPATLHSGAAHNP